jgi:hypothetical protein
MRSQMNIDTSNLTIPIYVHLLKRFSLAGLELLKMSQCLFKAGLSGLPAKTLLSSCLKP